MTVIDEVIEELSRLPGIGPRTALRLTYHLMKGPGEHIRRLAGALETLAERIRRCEVCGNFSESEQCDICRNTGRDRSVVCVVEEAYDVGAVERTGTYRGLFHVLGGHLSPLDGVGPEELSVAPLLERVRESDSEIEEVIVATNPSVEGEATATYLETVIRPLGPRVTRLARGIPMGSDLEYVDGSTIAEALAGRREM